MTHDIRLAFAHPSERAEATASSDPADRISLRDHVVEADIGAFQPERGRRQRLRFNVVVEVRPPDAPLDDDVDRILSYDALTEAIATELAAERLNLLETLADRVAARILAEPRAQRCFVRIEKLDRGPGALGVEIARSARPARRAVDGDAPHPIVVHLSNEAVASERLGAWLDALAGQPAILCVGMPDAKGPTANAPAAQRRVDLLAIEQNAWLLAARDRRCIVTGTRTELDWAIRNRRITVWAPSKIVLDTPDGFAGEPSEGASLTAWFARLMQAERLIYVGEAPPRGVEAEWRPLDTASLTDPDEGAR